MMDPLRLATQEHLVAEHDAIELAPAESTCAACGRVESWFTMSDPMRDSTKEHDDEAGVATLRVDVYLNGDRGYMRMDEYSNGHFGTSIGFPLKSTNGGPGGMASELMDEFYIAARRFQQRRSFRPGTMVTPIKGGGWKARIAHLDYEIGKATLDSGKAVLLRQMEVVEW